MMIYFFKCRRKAILIVLSLLLVVTLFFITLMNSYWAPDLYFVHWMPLENVSCHYINDNDVLASADDLEFPERSVFFHETSCNGGLDSRQACSVESAARAHPYWSINVLFMAPGTEETLSKSKTLLKEYRNIKFYRIHLTKYAKGTPLEDFVAEGALNRTRWRISHTSDVLRYLTLFKWGGVYLDLDVVVAKPFTSLASNWAARESEDQVAAGAMAFSRGRVGRKMAEATIRDMVQNYRGDDWGHNGPGVITRVLKDRCSTTDVSKMSAASCNGFEVYGPELFYPIEWQQGKTYFEVGQLPTQDAYVYHIWNHVTHDCRAVNGSLYEVLVKKYCPTVYKVYREDFD